MHDLDALAERAYQAFCNSPAHVYLPPRPPDWSDLPQVLKEAWKSAASAVLEK